MELNTETLSRFIGGQLGIQGKGYIYRGEIKGITVEDAMIKVIFLWLAQSRSLPPGGWINVDPIDYMVKTKTSSANELGNGRLTISSSNGDLAVFFPPGGRRLDPSKVEGLKLPD